jgi:Na+-translocating ferredoxin:NAD+ oxidoreductase subunit E
MKSLLSIFNRGLLKENPVFILMLGLCSVLAVSVSVVNAIGMTLAYSFVLICSELTISSCRKWIPKSLRVPIFILTIASFVTILGLVMKAYFPDLDKALGIFIPLIVVNCIIIGRVEAFAYRKSVIESLFDSLGMSAGYGIAIIAIAVVREILGNGTLFDIPLFGAHFQPALILILPPGAFLVIGLEIALVNAILKKTEAKRGTSK